MNKEHIHPLSQVLGWGEMVAHPVPWENQNSPIPWDLKPWDNEIMQQTYQDEAFGKSFHVGAGVILLLARKLKCSSSSPLPHAQGV